MGPQRSSSGRSSIPIFRARAISIHLATWKNATMFTEL
jgi:hypothetical protein